MKRVRVIIVPLISFLLLLLSFLVVARERVDTKNEVPLYTISSNEQQTEDHDYSDVFFDRYAYSTLNNEEKDIYSRIYSALVNFIESDPISVKEESTLKYVYDCVMIDSPELFYVNGLNVAKEYRDEEVRYVISGNYSISRSSVVSLQKKVDKKVNRILRGIPIDASDYECVKYVYDYINNTTDYVPDAADNQNIISVLLNGESVCQGYAKTFQYIMYALDIPCTVVTGEAGSGSISHSWNMVKLSGDYYHVDVTWGDMQDYNLISYDYLLIDDKTISSTHTIVSEIQYPECDSMKQNFYVMDGTFITSLNTECLDDVLPRINTSEEAVMTLKFSDQRVYDFYVDYLVADANLFRYMAGPIDYMLNADKRTLTIERRF